MAQQQRESFITYRSFHEALKGLPLDVYGKVMYIINEYALYQTEPDIEQLGELERACFILIKPQLDANIKKQDNGKFGDLGGRPTKKASEENLKANGEKCSEPAKKEITSKEKENKNLVGLETENPMGFEKTENKNPVGSEKIETENPMGFEKTENKNPNYNENYNYNSNENANENANSNSPNDEEMNFGKLQEEVFARLGTYNGAKDVPKERKIPVSGNKVSFIQKESRDLATLINCGTPSSTILEALENYISLAKNPRSWKTYYSWQDFIKNFVNFTPENFSPERFTNKSNEKAIDKADHPDDMGEILF